MTDDKIDLERICENLDRELLPQHKRAIEESEECCFLIKKRSLLNLLDGLIGGDAQVAEYEEVLQKIHDLLP